VDQVSLKEAVRIVTEEVFSCSDAIRQKALLMPDFNKWKTDFDNFLAHARELRRCSLVEQIEQYCNYGLSQREDGHFTEIEFSEHLQSAFEEGVWNASGRPYYNIHPQLVDSLCRCDLSTLPSSYLTMPNDFGAVAIRFAERNEHLAVSRTDYVRSMLLSRTAKDIASDFQEHGELRATMEAPPNSIRVRIDFGDRHPCGGFHYWTFELHCSRDVTLGESFEKSIRVPLEPERQRAAQNCLRLIATVGLIANCPQDDLLAYDVLAKHRSEYASSTDEFQRQRLIDKARRRGKVGWNVGTNELFLGPVEPQGKKPNGQRRGSHSTAHIRAGHLHAVRCGPGRKNVKIKWFRPTVVRPDLPFR